MMLGHCRTLFAVICLGSLAFPTMVRAGAREDQAGVEALIQRVKPIEATDYKQAIAEYTRYLQEPPDLDPGAGAPLSHVLFVVYLDKARDSKAALEVCDAALQKYASSPQAMWAVRDRVRLLLNEKRGADALALIKQHWHRLAGLDAFSRHWMLPCCFDAAEQLGQGQKALSLLQKGLLENPYLLDDAKHSSPGWICDRICRSLIDADHAGEALQWAKLRFVTCAFGTASIERSTQGLVRVWTARDLNSVVSSAFAEAQKDRARPNPLADVKLPEVSPDTVQATLAACVGPSQGHDRISVMIIAGMLGEAMGEARRMLVDNPESPAGVQEICRVFKAADLSVVRANAFIEFVKTGKGQNPIPAFFKEHPAEVPAR